MKAEETGRLELIHQEHREPRDWETRQMELNLPELLVPMSEVLTEASSHPSCFV